MNFIAPYMLWGTLAAAVPIAIHLFFRSRYRNVPWAAMTFLLNSIEQTSRRLKFQEMLLLLLRIALLVLLALALARPISSAFFGSGQGEAVDAVFLFDTSSSMATREGSETRLEKAKIAALDIVDRLPPYSTVQIISGGDRAVLEGPRAPANLEQARAIIENLKPSGLATDFRPAIEEAARVLQRAQMPNKELYLFSDMQKTGWEVQEGPLVDKLREIGKQAGIYLVRTGTRSPRNVAIVGITPQGGIPRPGQRIGFAVIVRNTGTEPVADLEVSLMVDGKEKERETQSIKQLGPGDTTAITLSALMEKAGLHVLSAKVKPDDLDIDNRFDQVILVRDAVRVLVVDGGLSLGDPAKSSSYYFTHALLPISEMDQINYHLRATVISPRQAVPSLLEKHDLCVLINAAVESTKPGAVQRLSSEFLDGLNHFVREGHGLMIFPGDNVDPDEYNQQFVFQRKILPYPIKRIAQYTRENPLNLNRETAILPVFRRFREDKDYKFLNNVEVWKALELELPAAKKEEKAGEGPPEKNVKGPVPGPPGQENVILALRYNNGQPALLSHRVDAGEVLLFTTSADPGWDKNTPDPTWTNLPLFPYFLPLVELSVNHLLHGQTQNHNVTAGNSLFWFTPKAEAKRSFMLYQPDGNRRRLGIPQMEQDRPQVLLDDLYLPGTYRLISLQDKPGKEDIFNDPILAEEMRRGTSTIGIPFAVVSDLSESNDLTTLSDEQIDAKLGFPVVHATVGQDISSTTGLDRNTREWTLWLLLLVLLVTLGEGVFAWFCGRPLM